VNPSQKTKLIELGIIIGLVIGFGIGFYFINLGYHKIQTAGDEISQSNRTIDQLTSVTQTRVVNGEVYWTISHPNPNKILLFYTLYTDAVFSVDNPIHYQLNAQFENKADIDQLVVLFSTSRNEDLSQITASNFNEFVSSQESFGDIIELYQNQTYSNEYDKIGSVTFNLVVPFHFDVVILEKNGTVISLQQKDDVLTLEPILSKLQSDTDRAILSQTIQSEKVTKAQYTTNDTVEGLTWVLIGLVPIGFAVEIVIVRYLEK